MEQLKTSDYTVLHSHCLLVAEAVQVGASKELTGVSPYLSCLLWSLIS